MSGNNKSNSLNGRQSQGGPYKLEGQPELSINLAASLIA